MKHRVTVPIENLQKLAALAPKEPERKNGFHADATVLDRARKYVAKIPGAISGQDGHGATFHAACTLVNDFALPEADALELLREWNQGCQPPWTEKELLHKITEAAKQPGPLGRLRENGQTKGASVSFGSAPPLGSETFSWPDPKELPSELLPVESFDFSLLPWSLEPWIRDISDRVQCPADFPAVGVMVAMAALVGRKLGIRPKRQDDWLVVPNLWGGIIGRPGIMKTPALQEVLNPIKRLEIAAAEKFRELRKDISAAEMVDRERKKTAEKEIRLAIQNGEDAHKVARALLDDEAEQLTRRRYLTNDATVEKLGEILNQNPNGVLIFRDELIGFLKSLDKEGHEGSRAFYLEAWNGTGRYTYDRIGRGTLDIEATNVSLLGGIQPGPLSDYLQKASQNGAGDDGLIQRFQLTVWPDVTKHWKNVDRWPDTQAKQTAYSLFQTLDQLTPESFGAKSDDHGDLPFVRFSPEAQSEFDQWRAGLEQRIRSGELHQVLESHLAKYRSLIPSLALLLELADGGHGNVGLEALQKAIAWGRYLESHANRMYGSVTMGEVQAAKVLTKKIQGGALKDGFVLRDVYRPGWSGLSDRTIAQQAVDLLCDLDWLQPKEIATEGRPKTEYLINPKSFRP